MKNTFIQDLKTCASERLVVGLKIRYVPAILFLCIESVNESSIIVVNNDMNGFPLPFKPQINIDDILEIKITRTRFEDQELVKLRQWNAQRIAFLNMKSYNY